MKKKIRKEEVNGFQYSQIKLSDTEHFIPSDFTVVESSLFKNLNKRAVDLVLRIVADLKQGNALWYYDHTKNTRDSMAIKELRDRDIIFKTDSTQIHLVNPKYIRKGTELEVLACTIKLLGTVSKVSRELIKNLRGGDKIEISMYDAIKA